MMRSVGKLGRSGAWLMPAENWFGDSMLLSREEVKAGKVGSVDKTGIIMFRR
jgi:hypothetical protein